MARDRKLADIPDIGYVQNPDIKYIVRRLTEIMEDSELPIKVRAAARKALGSDYDFQMDGVSKKLSEINTDMQLPGFVRVATIDEMWKIWDP